MKNLLLIIIVLSSNFLYSQTIISGIVKDSKGKAITGANVYIENTYDGGFTDINGVFSFKTNEKEEKTLVISFVSYKTIKIMSDITKMKNLKIVLKDEVNELNAVTITAGTFETGDNSKTAVLNPIDVVTTAGAEAGDINSAIKTLPGIQTVGEDGRLFVRGGDARETKVYIDGMHVFKPYLSTNQNTPTRSRFSSFLFKGVAFSSGGYSSEYGDALSGVLSMNTTDFPIQSKTDISIMTVGLGLGKTKKWEKDAISISANYINLAPYKALFPDKYEWKKPYVAFSGEGVYRHQFKSGLFKFYAAGTKSNAIINDYNVDYNKKLDSQIKNDNIYINYTFKGSINNKNIFFAGASYIFDKSKYKIDDSQKNVFLKGHHTKVKFTHIFNDQMKLSLGGERIGQNLSFNTYMLEGGSNSKQYAAFTEMKYLFTKNFVVKGGFRAEYADIIERWNTAPRISLAYRFGKYGQVSFAAGKYFQLPDMNFISSSNIKYENTNQYILNYSYKSQSRILRIEAYHKKYNDLILVSQDFKTISNLGKGFSRGLDVFWKDKKTLKFLEYWLSYSYLDSKKLYRNFPVEATPAFASKHNFSIVAKYWIGNIKSYPGITYTYSSPRPYNNPNSNSFMTEKTKSYHNLSLTWSYLISQQKILFFSFSNILGFENEYGYQYSRIPDSNGIYRSKLITPPVTRSIFIGFFWTISDDNKANQLDRL